MWEKIKKAVTVILAFLSVILFTILLFVLRRRSSDGQGSTDASERDRRIEEGITDSEERAERVEERIDRAGSAVERCEEHLQRAEDILRGAINRGRKTESET